MKQCRNNFNSVSERCAFLLMESFIFAIAVFWSPLAVAQTPLEVGPNTTIFFSDPLNTLVWEDKTGHATLDDVKVRVSEFKSAENLTPIQPKSVYWTAQRLRNSLGKTERLW